MTAMRLGTGGMDDSFVHASDRNICSAHSAVATWIYIHIYPPACGHRDDHELDCGCTYSGSPLTVFPEFATGDTDLHGQDHSLLPVG